MLPGTDERRAGSQTKHINSIPSEYQSSSSPMTRPDNILSGRHYMPETSNQLPVSGMRAEDVTQESAHSNLGEKNSLSKLTVDIGMIMNQGCGNEAIWQYNKE